MQIFIKFLYRSFFALLNLLYYFLRYVKHSSALFNYKSSEKVFYEVMKVNHAIEKSLIIKEHDFSRGVKTINYLKKIMIKTKQYINNSGLITHSSKIISDIESYKKSKKRPLIKKYFRPYNYYELNKQLKKFFESRHSVREFKKKLISKKKFLEIIKDASEAPSVCNRKSWQIYYTNNKKIIDTALLYQNGNSGFTGEIYNLAVVTIDLKAFMPGQEVYQGWIEGGIISASIIYAAHMRGFATCCLNWSATISSDRKLRQKLNISPSNNIIMMIAIGYTNEKVRVCQPYKHDHRDILKDLKIK